MQEVNGFKRPTRREAFERMVRAIESGEVTKACSYLTGDGKTCIIGCLFTPEQRAWIRANGLNQTRIADTHFQVSVGDANIEHMTGLSLAEVCILQDVWDSRMSHRVLPFLRRLLAKGRASLIYGRTHRWVV